MTLVVRDLEFRYGERVAIERVSLETRPSEIIALIGPNGCGKSTLLKAVSGLLPGVTGSVRVEGVELSTLRPAERARRIAYIPAETRAEFPIRAWEAVALGRLCHGESAGNPNRAVVERAMRDCACWEHRDRAIHSLSGGERQLVGLARVVAQESPILLLDESLSKMDLDHQSAIGRLLRKLAAEGRCIFLVAHDLNLASEWAERAILMKRGRVVADGPVASVLSASALSDLYPGAELVVGANPATGKPKVFSI